MTERKIPNTNKIKLYMHCGICITNIPPNTTPREWSAIEAGWTDIGFQVWCKRCEKNIIHLDFEGFRHPANTTANKA